MSAAASNGKGSWRPVALVIDGKNVPVSPFTVLTVDEDQEGYTVAVNGLFRSKVYQRGIAKRDYDKMPPQSDVTVTAGPQAGQTLRQIFKYEGDLLIACSAPPGAARPTDFTSRPGSGHTLSVWVRSAAASPPGPLTGRTWLAVGLLLVVGVIVGSVSQDMEASLGHWAGILGGWLSGVCVYTAFVLLLKKPWQVALATGATISVAGITFEGLKTTLTPTLGALGAIFVSASTAIVAAFLVGGAITRLTKVHFLFVPYVGDQKPIERG